VFHVEHKGWSEGEKKVLHSAEDVPRETACAAVGTLLNFRRVAFRGGFGKNHRGGKPEGRGRENDDRRELSGMPRRGGSTDTPR